MVLYTSLLPFSCPSKHARHKKIWSSLSNQPKWHFFAFKEVGKKKGPFASISPLSYIVRAFVSHTPLLHGRSLLDVDPYLFLGSSFPLNGPRWWLVRSGIHRKLVWKSLSLAPPLCQNEEGKRREQSPSLSALTTSSMGEIQSLGSLSKLPLGGCARKHSSSSEARTILSSFMN